MDSTEVCDNRHTNTKLNRFKHQEDALAKGWDKLEFAFFMEMGTGKSKVLLDNLGMLYLAGHIKFALILAPKGVYRNWVTKEIPEHMSDDVPHRVIRWVSGPNKKQQEEMRSVKDPFNGLTIFVMNVESYSTRKGQSCWRVDGKCIWIYGMYRNRRINYY